MMPSFLSVGEPGSLFKFLKQMPMACWCNRGFRCDGWIGIKSSASRDSPAPRNQAAIDAWLPHAELLWRFRSRLERLDFRGPLVGSESTSGKHQPNWLLIAEGLFQIAEGNLAAAVPHLLAFGDRLAIDGSTNTKGSRLSTPVTGVVRLHLISRPSSRP